MIRYTCNSIEEFDFLKHKPEEKIDENEDEEEEKNDEKKGKTERNENKEEKEEGEERDDELNINIDKENHLHSTIIPEELLKHKIQYNIDISISSDDEIDDSIRKTIENESTANIKGKSQDYNNKIESPEIHLTAKNFFRQSIISQNAIKRYQKHSISNLSSEQGVTYYIINLLQIFIFFYSISGSINSDIILRRKSEDQSKSYGSYLFQGGRLSRIPSE